MSLLLLGAGRAGAAGPATEDIRPSSTTSVYVAPVGAATAHAALADNSDSSRVEGDQFFAQWVGGFGDLVSAAGRAIASFTIIVRADSQASSTCEAVPTVTGATVAGNGTFTPTGSPSNMTTGPFTRSGGGNFTEAMLNSLTADVFLDTGDGTPRLYEVTVRVTYA